MAEADLNSNALAISQEAGEMMPVRKSSALDQIEAFTQSRAMRQLTALLGLAAVAAVAISLVLWMQKPASMPVYNNLSQSDAAAVVDALRVAGMAVEVDRTTGSVMVPADKVHEARLLLASQGLPNSSSTPLGLELLNEKQELGTSQFMEQARFNHALEVELARSIASLKPVESARIHLAIPKRSVFVRKQEQASASVLVKLYPGRALEKGQVASIVHMVASSIPYLTASNVTVVDQFGNLLTDADGDSKIGLTSKQFEYARAVEESMVDRVEFLLEPILGAGKVRAEVSADIDFSEGESTKESYQPDNNAVRSEQINEQGSRAGGPLGVPGALTNQPPEGGVVNGQGPLTLKELADLAGVPVETLPPAIMKRWQELEKLASSNVSTNVSTTRNYEMDRTVSHTKHNTGTVSRLSVAVVVDDKVVPGSDGKVTRQPRTQEELDKLTELVKRAVGFNAERGDSVQVVNASFEPEPEIAPVAEEPVWKQAWVWDVAKQIVVVLLVFILYLKLVKPLLATLAGPSEREIREQARIETLREAGLNTDGTPRLGKMSEDTVTLSGAHGGKGGESFMAALTGPANYEEKVERVRELVAADPDRVTTVFKEWIQNDG